MEVKEMIEKQIKGRAFWLCEPYSITISGESKILYSWTHDASKAMRLESEVSAQSFNEPELSPDEKKRILDTITECREMAEEITKFANKHLRGIQTEIQRLQQQYDKITQKQ